MRIKSENVSQRSHSHQRKSSNFSRLSKQTNNGAQSKQDQSLTFLQSIKKLSHNIDSLTKVPSQIKPQKSRSKKPSISKV